MARKILLGVVALIAVLLLVVVTRPATFHVERAVDIDAPAPIVFAQIDDFHAWGQWSPWEKLDPSMAKTYEGPNTGVGAKYAWKGNDKIGEGRMTIERADAARLVGIKLEFLKPFAATNDTTFTLSPTPAGTHVVWAMDGNNDFMGKAASLFMNMDTMVGGDFDRGLSAMKAVAERQARAGRE